jgi:hypothetical protein
LRKAEPVFIALFEAQNSMSQAEPPFSEDIKGTPFEALPMVIGHRYRFLRIIGKGTFGL